MRIRGRRAGVRTGHRAPTAHPAAEPAGQPDRTGADQRTDGGREAGRDPIDARLDRVGRELVAATGGASLCAVSRSGGPVDGVKYLEGRLAALSELRRRGRDAPDRLDAIADELADEWRRALAEVTRREAGGAWIAYRAGGVDELAELTESPRRRR